MKKIEEIHYKIPFCDVRQVLCNLFYQKTIILTILYSNSLVKVENNLLIIKKSCRHATRQT